MIDGVYTFGVKDVVTFFKEWCVLCAKSRLHESYKIWGICVVCGTIAEVAPKETVAEAA